MYVVKYAIYGYACKYFQSGESEPPEKFFHRWGQVYTPLRLRSIKNLIIYLASPKIIKIIKNPENNWKNM